MSKNATKRKPSTSSSAGPVTPGTTDINDLKVLHEPDPMVNPDEYRFDREFVELMQEEPFLGCVSMYVPKVADWKCDTAYVCADRSGNTRMGFNPDFMRRLTSKHRKGVIKHELFHIVFMHIAERNVADRRKAKLWNFATDLAINSIIKGENLPEFCLLPGRAPKTDDPKLAALIAGFPQLESSDWYMARLQEYAEANGQGQGGEGEGGEYVLDMGNENGETLDGHGQWADVPDELRDIMKEQVRDLIEKGVKQAQQRASWGTVPSEIQGLIEAMIRHELDWKAILRMFVGRARSMERFSTIRRLNKRLPYMMPGCRRTTKANLLFAIDQSGSVGDDDVARGLAAAFDCSKEAGIDILNFDTEVDLNSLQHVENGQNFKWKRTRCGGTDFDCVQRFLNDPKHRGKWSAVVMFTDGYAPKMGVIVGTKVMFLITETGDAGAARPGDLIVKMGPESKTVKRA